MALEHWLHEHPKVRDAIRWQEPGGSVVTYGQWSVAQRVVLDNAYATAAKGHATGLPDPPANLVQVTGNDYPTTVLSHVDAWLLYVAHVAQSLAVETEKRVEWSLTGCTAKQLAVLLDSRQFFSWDAEHSGYSLDESIGGLALPAAPDTGWGLIEQVRQSPAFQAEARPVPDPGIPLELSPRSILIARLLGWCRDNMLHFEGAYTARETQTTWQYRGMPPVVRIISGTHNPDYSKAASKNFSHWTAGCRGTVGFLRAVLRTANVPVAYTTQAGHGQPFFMTEGSYLSHGDDPYNRLVTKEAPATEPPYPASFLLIGQTVHDEWFGAGVSDKQRKNNVGRRTVDLAIPYLPMDLLNTYCRDQAAGLSHSQGAVYKEIFKRLYKLSELNAAHLWKRMDEKLATLGGCP